MVLRTVFVALCIPLLAEAQWALRTGTEEVFLRLPSSVEVPSSSSLNHQQSKTPEGWIHVQITNASLPSSTPWEMGLSRRPPRIPSRAWDLLVKTLSSTHSREEAAARVTLWVSNWIVPQAKPSPSNPWKTQTGNCVDTTQMLLETCRALRIPAHGAVGILLPPRGSTIDLGGPMLHTWVVLEGKTPIFIDPLQGVGAPTSRLVILKDGALTLSEKTMDILQGKTIQRKWGRRDLWWVGGPGNRLWFPNALHFPTQGLSLSLSENINGTAMLVASDGRQWQSPVWEGMAFFPESGREARWLTLDLHGLRRKRIPSPFLEGKHRIQKRITIGGWR